MAMATIPAASAAVAPAGSLDPVFALIAAHKQAVGTVDGIVAEINRAVEIDEQTALEQGRAENICSPRVFTALTQMRPWTHGRRGVLHAAGQGWNI